MKGKCTNISFRFKVQMKTTPKKKEEKMGRVLIYVISVLIWVVYLLRC